MFSASLGVSGSLGGLAGCGAAGRGTGRPADLVLQLPATDYLPDGAHFVVVAQPIALMDAPATASVIAALIPSERFDTFRAHNGIDPRTLTELAYAEYRDGAGASLGTVLVVRGPFNARVAVGEMAHRMIPVESERDEPYYRRGGIYAGLRRDAIAIDEHTLVLVTGSPVLAERALAIAEPRSLEGDAGAITASLAAGGAPLLVLWPQPLNLPLGTDLALILARERALGVALRGDGDGRVELVAEARGEFPPGIEDNLRALAQSLSYSDMGHRLGMAELEGTLEVHVTPNGVRASGALSAATLAEGLRALLVAEIAEIVGEEAPPSTPDRPPIHSGSGR